MDTETPATMTSKGQVTVPKRVRDEMGLNAGDQLVFVRTRSGKFSVKKRVDPDRFARWRGYFKDLQGQDPDALIEDWRGR